MEMLLIQEPKQRRMEVGMCKTIDDLIAIQKQRGYAKGWVYTMARLKKIPIRRD